MVMMPTTCQNKELYIEVVRAYLSWVVKYYPSADDRLISELLRHSLCVALNLESTGANRVVDEISEGSVKVVKKVLKKTDIMTKSDEFKQGFLEACVHCIEFAKRRC